MFPTWATLPLGNAISEGKYHHMFCTDLHFSRIGISD